MQDFRQLNVWEKSHKLVLMIYEATAHSSEKKYPGLASQIRRAAASIPTNIAEGCGHSSPRGLARFLGMALASSSELRYHLQLGLDLGLFSTSDFARLDARTEQVKRMLTSLVAKVRQNAERLDKKNHATTPTASGPPTADR